MIDAIAIDLMTPPAIIQPVRSRGRDRRRSRRRERREHSQPSPTWRGYAIGAVLILNSGNECRLMMDPEGNWLCRDERGQLWELPQ